MEYKPNITLDRVRGMFMGVFLGDALGAPHEFTGSNLKYTGKLEHITVMNSRFQGQRQLDIGRCSDDTEMTITLLRTLIQYGGYNRDHVIISYLRWANSGGWMMGKNTRALLKGVTTVKGYQGRLSKILALPISERSQSNGAMMRCSPLALIYDNRPVVEDVNITNPTPVCVDCNLVYISALRLALQGLDGNTIFNTIKTVAQTDEVKFVLLQVERKENRNISEKKGWCLHALWCAMTVMISFNDYSQAMRWIISDHPHSDTDTNACIAGALVGAILGFDRMNIEPSTSENITILLNTDTTIGLTPRPIEYGPTDFFILTEAAMNLTMK